MRMNITTAQTPTTMRKGFAFRALPALAQIVKIDPSTLFEDDVSTIYGHVYIAAAQKRLTLAQTRW